MAGMVQAGVDRNALVHAMKVSDAKVNDSRPQRIAVVSRAGDRGSERR
jgi:hypothetical protein